MPQDAEKLKFILGFKHLFRSELLSSYIMRKLQEYLYIQMKFLKSLIQSENKKWEN